MKRTRKKNFKCKGMTLIEIIISLFIFSLMALMMVRICTTSNDLTRNANHVNRKVTAQAPLAEIQNTSGTLTELENDNLKIAVVVDGVTVNVKASQYSTAKSVENNDFATTNGDFDLEFVKVDLSKNSGAGIWEEPTTEATTEAPTE